MEELKAAFPREAQASDMDVPGALVHGVPEGIPMAVKVFMALAASKEAQRLTTLIQVTLPPRLEKAPTLAVVLRIAATVPAALLLMYQEDPGTDDCCPVSGKVDLEHVGHLDSVIVGEKQIQDWLQQ